MTTKEINFHLSDMGSCGRARRALILYISNCCMIQAITCANRHEVEQRLEKMQPHHLC